jgi:peptidoglycan/xylan/chitin deacetylase (PgdA/CDA1 family)
MSPTLLCPADSGPSEAGQCLAEPEYRLPELKPAAPGVTRKKQWSAQCWNRCGGVAAQRHWNRLGTTVIPILAYHRVFEPGPIDRYPYDIELISADRARFEWQMGYVKTHYHPIRFADLLASFDGQAELPPRPVIVTFDDGYADNHTHAFPILRQLGVPATIFLSTGYIGGPMTFWYDRLAHSILRTRKTEVTLGGVGTYPLPGTPAERRHFLSRVMRLIKDSPNSARLTWLCEIEEQLSDAPPSERDPRSRPLDWSQVREMAEAGIEFGSHTVSHPILSRCSPDEVQFELAESFATLGRHVDRFAPVLSYPVGGPAAFNDQVIDEARRCGYRLAASYIHGRNTLSTLDRFALRRIHVERYHDADHFAAMLEWPERF